MNDKFVTIKGVKYDASTGLPVSKVATAKKTPKVHGVHSLAQKSRAIRDRAASATVSSVKAPLRKIGRNMDIARSKSISRFAKPNTPKVARPITSKKPDLAPKRHPLATKIADKQAVVKLTPKPVAKTAKQIKDESIAAALAKPVTKSTKQKGFSFRKLKLSHAIIIGAVLLLIAGYFTYANMPALSVRVAGAQAGIDAKYPDYHPDGYTPSGPVTYSDGEVNINFHSNTGNSRFTIKEVKSSWDSTAVKEKVSRESNGEFITTEERWLTIYTYGGNATWVNGGILYTITGNAPISNEQIIRIATSL